MEAGEFSQIFFNGGLDIGAGIRYIETLNANW